MSPIEPSPVERERSSIGRALRALRERIGLSQEAAAAELGITRQAWQNYEAGHRNTLLRTDLQDRLASALGLTRDDLIRERDRQAGRESYSGVAEAGTPFELEVSGRVKTGDNGPQVYDLDSSSARVDVSWIFGPDVRILRHAGDSMPGFVSSGELVIYDVAQWPSRGDGCVVELKTGDAMVCEYIETVQGVVRVRQYSPDETIAIPLPQVRGVYKVRLRGV